MTLAEEEMSWSMKGMHSASMLAVSNLMKFNRPPGMEEEEERRRCMEMPPSFEAKVETTEEAEGPPELSSEPTEVTLEARRWEVPVVVDLREEEEEPLGLLTSAAELLTSLGVKIPFG